MREQTFVLTGATGFLGSHLMAALVARGDPVIVLGRPSATECLASRVGRLLTWFGIPAKSLPVETVEADLLEHRLGLPIHRYQALCAKSGTIIHCASDTRFSERNRSESVRTNVDSLKELINFAGASRAPFFHYVSTAYVSGRSSIVCPEMLSDVNGFANVYEETKARAEKVVAAGCSADSVPYTILRPSIVYGDSRTGRANRFNALYYHVKALYYIREIYLNDILTQRGRKSSAWGIHLDSKGTLHLPLRISLAGPGFVNLIPIDYFVSAVLSLAEKAETGTIYHITSDSPKTTEEIASYCELFLKMKGIRIARDDPPKGARLNPAEALFNKVLEPYRPYLSDTRLFERSNTDRALAGLKPPEFTYGIFERCMNYAVSSNWENARQ